MLSYEAVREHFCVGVIHISSHQLTFIAVVYTFRAVCFGHKLATAVFDLEKLNPCKLLRIERILVAGGGIEPPTLGL